MAPSFIVCLVKLTIVGTLLLGIVATGGLAAQSTPSEALVILAKRDSSLAIVDPSSLKILARVPAGPDPHEVIASADGRFAYVSNYGGGAYNTLTVIDLVAQKTLPAIDLGALRGPHGLIYVGGKVWFTAEAAKVVGSYDPAAKNIDFVLGTGQNRTHMIYVSPDMKRIVTTNVSSASVSVIEKSTTDGARQPGPPPGPGGPAGPRGGDWNQTLIPVGKGAEGFDVSPDSKEIWVANAQDGTASVIDVGRKTVTQTLAADVPGANRLKFTPDGKLVLISSLRGSELTVIDRATRKTVKRIPVGHGAAGIVMQPDGARAFVACSPDNYVVVLDLHTLEVTARIETGHEPDGVAWVVRR